MPAARPDLEAAPGGAGPLAVIDIGSNSIRLVVYSGLVRGASTLFNEKVLCGLGRGLAQTGRLNPDGVALARQNLVRFTRLAAAMGVGRVDLLATAAVREAEDGPAFAAEVERLTSLPITVLTGEEEGRLSALGVVAGLPGASGVMGDLGGGSLELVELSDGGVGRSSTLPLGPFNLMARHDSDTAAMLRTVDAALKADDWQSAGKKHNDRRLYAVGGAWRNLARIHIEQSRYPLNVIHGYTMTRGQVGDLARVMSRLSKRSLARIKGVTKQRLETLPVAALVLHQVIRALGCREVEFSAFGLREGHVYNLMSAAEQARDPLLAVSAEMARREARFGHMGDAMLTWTDPLFQNESEAEQRLRHASCLLSDIAWREHPSYRAMQALYRILHYPFIGLGHRERIFLGYAVYLRYSGSSGRGGEAVAPYIGVLSAEQRTRAEVLGLAQRLAYRVSGATRAVLERTRLALGDDGTLRLALPDDGSVPGGEAVERRLAALADALGRKPVIGEG